MNCVSYSRALYLLITAALLSGCESVSPINVVRYSSNPLALQVLLDNPDSSVSVGSIKMGQGIGENLSCLNEEIPLPDGATIAEYIRTSLIAELAAAGQYNPNAQNTISGSIETAELEFTRRVMLAAHGGTWHIRINLTSTNGESIVIKSSHSYDTGYAPIRCNIAADYVMPAIQTLIYDIVRDSEFHELY